MEVLANNEIPLPLFVSLFESGTLRLFNHTNTEHFLGFCLRVFCQALPLQVLNALIY